MRKLTLILLALLAVLFVAQQAHAGDDYMDDSDDEFDGDSDDESASDDSDDSYVDSDDGPVLIGEVTLLDLDDTDNMWINRLIMGYTFEVGIQVGGHLSTYYLDRPSVAGQNYGSVEEPVTLDEQFLFWGFGPMIGFDLELIQGWFGFEFMVTPSFPITDGSSGWSVETGVDVYFSFEGMSDNSFDLALMAGIKYGHFDVGAGGTPIVHDRMMPTAGFIGQF